MTETPNFFAMIPANVRYSKDLQPREILLYAEISALCTVTGFCWARNKYLAEKLGVSVSHISRMIQSLQDKGYIRIVIDKMDGNARRIYLDMTAHMIEPDEKKAVGETPISTDADTLSASMPIPIRMDDDSIYNDINIKINKTKKERDKPPLISLSQTKFAQAFPDKAIDCVFDDAKYDIDVLLYRVEHTPFLKLNSNITLKSCIKHYDKIISGGYKPYEASHCLPVGIVRHDYTDEEFKSMFTDLNKVAF